MDFPILIANGKYYNFAVDQANALTVHILTQLVGDISIITQ